MSTVPRHYIDKLHRRMDRNDLHLSQKCWEALENIPREYFVGSRKEAYNDYPLPIPSGQTISAPHMYAMMLSEELTAPRQGMDILEIGTGSGYGAALLAYVVNPGKVVTIERHAKLVQFAKKNLERLDLNNIEIIHGDGTLGKSGAKFDRILVTAAGPKIPRPLLDQLKDNGRMIIPLEKHRGSQWLSTVHLEEGKPVVSKKFQVRFVPLIGREGYDR